MTTLLISEIYATLQGEGLRAGRPCALVRLAGCNLRCAWCDTSHARDDGREMDLPAVLAEVRRLALPMVLVTGGEPLLQAAAPALLSALCDLGLEVLLQTNGSLDLSGVDARVTRCMDVKCPLSGQGESCHWPNLRTLNPRDEAKFILAGREDYDFACRVVKEHALAGRCAVIFSPAFGLLPPARLAAWILEDRLDVRLGLQLHKIIWPGVERGV